MTTQLSGRTRAGAVAALVAAVWAAPAAQRAVPPQERVAFVNARVINVRNGAIQAGATVVVAAGKIESVGSGAAPAGARAIDLQGRHLLPGLIDAHVHIASFPQMRNALETGVTTVRSAGVSSYMDVGLRDLVRKGHLAGPDVLAAGYHVRVSPAPELFLSDPDLGDLLGGVTSVDGLRRVVRANLAHGVDWIKVLATERAGTPDTDPRKQMFSEAELKAMVDEAGAKKVGVMAHAHGAEGALAAVRAGVRSIEHGTYLTDEALQLMAKQGTYLDPTADIVNDLSAPGGDYDNAALQRRGQMMQPVLEAAVRRASALGVKIVAGSDTGYGPQSVTTLAREVVTLSSFGLSALDAIQAATIRNAELLKLDARVGAVESGYEADLLVVDANPLQNVRALLDPLLVMSNGRVAVNRLTFGK